MSGSPSSSFTCSSFSGVRPIRARRAPSDFSSCAVQRPMPEPPPVTMMVWPANRPGRKTDWYCMVLFAGARHSSGASSSMMMARHKAKVSPRSRRPAYSILMLAAFTTSAHLAISPRRKAASSCGVEPTASAPRSANLALMSVHAHDLRHLGVQALQHGRRRAGRGDQGVPFGDLAVLHAGFGHGRHVGRGRRALGAGDGERAHACRRAPAAAPADMLPK